MNCYNRNEGEAMHSKPKTCTGCRAGSDSRRILSVSRRSPVTKREAHLPAVTSSSCTLPLTQFFWKHTLWGSINTIFISFSGSCLSSVLIIVPNYVNSTEKFQPSLQRSPSFFLKGLLGNRSKHNIKALEHMSVHFPPSK